MKAMHYLCRLTAKQLSLSTKELVNFARSPAIINRFCQRCGSLIKNDGCEECDEFGRLTLDDYLYQKQFQAHEITEVKHGHQLQLTANQEQASQFILTNYHEQNDCLVWAVCGAGKTEICFRVIEECLSDGFYVGFAIPRIDVLYEVAKRLRKYFTNCPIAILNGHEKKIQDGIIYVVTTNQLLKFANAFHLLIIDEVDAYPYFDYPKFEFAANNAVHPQGIKCYLTATANNELLQRKIETYTICRRFHGYDIPLPILVKQHTKALPFKVLKLFKPLKRQLLVFCPSVKKCWDYYQRLVKWQPQYVIEWIHGTDPDRIRKVDDFTNKKIDIIVCTTILERGVTFADIDVLIINSDHRVFDQATLIQIAGRVRRNKDYQEGNIFFLFHNLTPAMSAACDIINQMNNGKISTKYASIKTFS